MLHQRYPVSSLVRASPPPTRPDLSLAGRPLRFLSAVFVGFPCFLCVPSMHAVVYIPADLQDAFIASFSCNTGLSRKWGGSASALWVSGPHRTFTCVTACIFAASSKMTLSIEGSDGFVASTAASIATGQATLPRRDLHPLKHTNLHGAPTFFHWAPHIRAFSPFSHPLGIYFCLHRLRPSAGNRRLPHRFSALQFRLCPACSL